MKKLLSLLVMVMAFAVNVFSQDVEKLYIMGSGTTGGWGTTTEMTYNETTQAFEYALEVTSKAYFCIGDAAFDNWDNFNANARWALAAGDNDATVGKEVQLVKTNGTIVVEPGKYIVSVTKDMKMTIKLVEEVAPETLETLWIVGELTGGWPNGDDWSMAKQMTKDESKNIWTLTLTEITVEAKKYEYKATANKKWGIFEIPGSGNNDITFGTEEHPVGIYTLVFTANLEDAANPALTLAATKTGDVTPEPQPELNTFTAKFENAAGWEKVYAYAFTYVEGQATTEFLGAWPGTELAKGEDGKFIVTITAEAAPDTIIFNNGAGIQTENILFENGKEYTNKVDEPVVPTFTAKFENAAGWEKVYAYAFTYVEGQATTEFLGAWPGTELAKGEDGKFIVTITAEAAPDTIIFNNGAGIQTENIAFEDGKEYTNKIDEPVLNTYAATLNNEAGWEEVYAYTFNAETLGAWPGTKLEVGRDGKFTVTFTAESAPAFIIFNNGKQGEGAAQTANLKFENGKVYTNQTTFSVAFEDVAKWGTIYAYAFTYVEGQGVTEYLGAWPGTAMTEFKDGKLVLSFNAAEAPAFIIFNNGIEGEGAAQTIDLAFDNGKDYRNDDLSVGIAKVQVAERRAVVYTISGQRVTNPAKGLYIVNGKKVMVK